MYYLCSAQEESTGRRETLKAAETSDREALRTTNVARKAGAKWPLDSGLLGQHSLARELQNIESDKKQERHTQKQREQERDVAQQRR